MVDEKDYHNIYSLMMMTSKPSSHEDQEDDN